MNAAIFGANGYLGRHLTRFLLNVGVECFTFDVHDKAMEYGSDYCMCNIANRDWWTSFEPRKYNVIFFFAGLSGVEQSFQDPEEFENVNVVGLLQLLECLRPLGKSAPRILFPSSRLVYRGGGIVTEDSPVEPRSVYAATKLACEALLSAYKHRFGIPYAVFRICVPYGNLISNSYSYGTLGFFMRQAIAGNPITVYGDGSNIKTYTYIEDICSIFYKVAVDSNITGLFNVGGFDYSLKEVAEMVAKGRNGRIEYIPWPKEALCVEMGDISLNASKLAEKLGFTEYKRMEDCIEKL